MKRIAKTPKELKKQVRGIRPIEREAEQQGNEEAMITRKYCLAVRSALTDDGHPPRISHLVSNCTSVSL
jgi:hypothetical protein